MEELAGQSDRRAAAPMKTAVNETPTPTMPIYEYRNIGVPDRSGTQTLAMTLFFFSLEGWEFCGTIGDEVMLKRVVTGANDA